MIRQTIPAIAVLLLAGCNTEPAPVAPAGNDTRAAEGDVLEGSISDAMIPTDAVKSVSPPIKAAPKPAGASVARPTSSEEQAQGDSAQADIEEPAAPSEE